jgi:DNA (cytosine-5)-methyltransferase 1
MVQLPIYGKERRYITPRECARLQSFPESFQLCESDQQAYKQFGNAVNVDVVDLVMKTTMRHYGYLEN